MGKLTDAAASEDANLAALVRQQKSEIRDLHKRLLAATSGEAMVREVLQEVYQHPPDLEPPRAPQKRSGRKRPMEAWLHISDTQIGKRTRTYSSEVCAERLMLLAEKTLDITDTLRATHSIETLHILLGGDMVEGETIFPGQPHEIDSDLFTQAVRAGPEMMARCILRLCEGFQRVSVAAVPGNHGRAGPKFGGNSKRTNWDRVFYEVLGLMLLGPEGSAWRKDMEKRIEYKPSETFYSVQNVCGWGILGVHGDQIRGGFAGHPWYGTSKKAGGWIDSIPERWDILAYGHFHTYAAATLNRRYWMCNGTTESDNEYAQEQMAAAGEPVQRLCFFTEKHGLVSEWKVYLGEDREKAR